MLTFFRNCCLSVNSKDNWQYEQSRCSICFTPGDFESRCDCKWQLLCDECTIVQKKVANPCILCHELLTPNSVEDQQMVFSMKVLAEIAAYICYLDDKAHGNNIVALRGADFDQIRALLICADIDDIYDARDRLYDRKEGRASVETLMEYLYTMEDNNGFKQGFLTHYRSRIPSKKRQRQEDEASLNCWVVKNKVKCNVYALPPRNIVYTHLNIHDGKIQCRLSIGRHIPEQTGSELSI